MSKAALFNWLLNYNKGSFSYENAYICFFFSVSLSNTVKIAFCSLLGVPLNYTYWFWKAVLLWQSSLVIFNLEKLLARAVFEAFLYFNLLFAYACLLLCWLYYFPLSATVINSNNYWTKFGDIRNNQGQGKCYQLKRRPMLITLTDTLIIQDYHENQI